VTTCVVGAGVIGSLYAAHLSQVGRSTVLTRRAEHAVALNANGLSVTGRSDFVARVTAATSAADLPEPELVIVATKAAAVEDAAAALEGHWPTALVMTVQNGLGA
jgi:2-dehydropantoate 2-reductase